MMSDGILEFSDIQAMIASMLDNAVAEPPCYEDQAWWLNAFVQSPPRSVALHDENGEVVGWQHTFTPM